jgi:excisionase family DNA binding protein
MKDRLLRPDQAAIVLNVHPRTVYRMVAEGAFQCLRVRGSLRILESSLHAYVKRQMEAFELEIGFGDISDVD